MRGGVGSERASTVRRLLLGLALALAGSGAARADHTPRHCLAMAIYWEAKSCGREDMTAVGWVVLNRQADGEFPAEICAVVKQGGERPGCQFSWWCDGKSDRPEDDEAWRRAREVADALLTRPPPDPTGGALFFHSKEIERPWSVSRKRTAAIGCHIFYK